MTRWAMIGDLERCVGCQTCTAACKHANATAPGVQWRKVLDFEVGSFPDVKRAFMPVGCMHCADPPCMAVCPSTATGRRDDGIVTIDYDICIGCAYCAVACPYQARYKVDRPAVAFGSGKAMRHESLREDPARMGVAQKCTFCVDRIDEGLASGLLPGVDDSATPACVASCIAGALHFGDLDDATSNVSQILEKQEHFTMHEELGTGPAFYYTFGKEGGKKIAPGNVPMVADPAGLAGVSPVLQKHWDWRAAMNFILGGTGTGLFLAAAIAGLFAPASWLAALAGLAFVGGGLFFVWLEIGRPLRFLNVYRNPRTSWMSREALAALPYFALGLMAIWAGLPIAGLAAAAFGILFLYCQGQILKASRGIPAWRQSEIVPLIIATGLAEGTGAFSVLAFGTGNGDGVLRAVGMALVVLVLVRHLLWRRYRRALDCEGVPVGALGGLDGPFGLTPGSQGITVGLLVLGLWLTPLVPLAGLFVLALGWVFKFNLITRAAFNQGFALNRMPARGSNRPSEGIKPGWVRNAPATAEG